MLAKELMSDVVFPLKIKDTGMKALNLMDVFRITHLPVVNDEGGLLGVVSEMDVIDQNAPEDPIGDHYAIRDTFVYEHQHLYDVVEMLARMKMTAMPVLDRNKKYLGLITVAEVLQQMGRLYALKQPGAIIVLRMYRKDYTASEISQIIEGNDAKILSLYLSDSDDPQLIEVTIKLNKTEINPIVQTFERYNYNITTYSGVDEDDNDFLSDRYESFIRYLNT